MDPSDLMLAVVNLWVQTLLGVPTPSDLKEESLETKVVYSALYDLKVRQCAKLVVKMRKLSLRLAASGKSPKNAGMEKGWQWANLLQTCAEDPENASTSWAHFILRMVSDSQDIMGEGTLSSAYLFAAKLHAVVSQMETETRKLRVEKKALKEDKGEKILVKATKRLRAQVKARLGAAELQVAPTSTAGTIALRQAYSSAKKTVPLSSLSPTPSKSSQSSSSYSAPTFELTKRVGPSPSIPSVNPADVTHGLVMAQRLVCKKAQQVKPIIVDGNPVGFVSHSSVTCVKPSVGGEVKLNLRAHTTKKSRRSVPASPKGRRTHKVTSRRSRRSRSRE